LSQTSEVLKKWISNTENNKAMKKIFLFVICFNAISLIAQTDFRFADSTAQWNICVAQFMDGGPTFWADVYHAKYYVSKDTSLNNFFYQKIQQEQRYYDFTFIRKDSAGKVFVFSDYLEKDLMMYDFNANVGDTVTIYPISSFSLKDSVMVRVDSISIYNRGGVSRKQLNVSLIGSYSKTDIWIEGIGSLKSYFLNPFLQEVSNIPGSEYYLMNYTDNNYTDSFAISCFNWAGIAGQTSIPFYVYPNPTSQTIFLKTENYKNQKVRFFDVVGREIFSTEIQDSETQIDVSQWQRGVYFYSILKEGVPQQNGKIVLE